MKRNYISVVNWLANLLRGAAGLAAALPIAGLRIVRLYVDVMPDGVLISSGVLEWALGLLGLLVLLRRSNNQMEKDNASAS